jgi:hypothetical protein
MKYEIWPFGRRITIHLIFGGFGMTHTLPRNSKNYGHIPYFVSVLVCVLDSASEVLHQKQQ